MTDIDNTQIHPGDRVRFDGKATSWLVRAESEDARYLLATASFFGDVAYTIVDRQEGIRGAMNVIGGGLDIFTTTGPDPAINKAMLMLRPELPWPPGVTSRPADPLRGWEISHRNRVRLDITRHVPAEATQ